VIPVVEPGKRGNCPSSTGPGDGVVFDQRRSAAIVAVDVPAVDRSRDAAGVAEDPAADPVPIVIGISGVVADRRRVVQRDRA